MYQSKCRLCQNDLPGSDPAAPQVSTVGQVVPSYLPGVRVTDLMQVSAARDAGVLSGDVIVAVNGQAARLPQHLPRPQPSLRCSQCWFAALFTRGGAAQ